MPLISIIIPTFNSAATLAAALGSIAAQEEASVEVCIVDGGSTDATAQIVRQWQDKLSIQWHQEPDNGIYDAMNKGMRIATGDWLLFLGSDDTLYSESVLKELSGAITTYDADMLYGDVKIMGNTGWAVDGDVYDGAFSLEKLLQKNICHQAICYRSAFMLTEIGDYTLRYAKSADWDVNLRCFARGKVQYVPILVARFAAGGASTESTDHALAADFVSNLQTYFGWGLFHPMLTIKGTWFYPRVVKKQREQYPVRVKLSTFVKNVTRKIRKLFL